MIGFWISIYGMLFGTLCSLKAKEKNRYPKNWFTLGFIFGVFAYLFLIMLPAENEPAKEVSYNLG